MVLECPRHRRNRIAKGAEVDVTNSTPELGSALIGGLQIFLIAPSLPDIECLQDDLALLSRTYRRSASLGDGRGVLRVQGPADPGGQLLHLPHRHGDG